VVVETLDLALLDRDQLDLGSGILERLPWLGELDLLDHVGRDDGAFRARQIRHLVPLSRSGRFRPFRGARTETSPPASDPCGRGTSVAEVRDRSGKGFTGANRPEERMRLGGF